MDEQTTSTVMYTQDQFIAVQLRIIKGLQQQIIEGFEDLDYFRMEELKGLITYRRKLIGLARSGKFVFSD